MQLIIVKDSATKIAKEATAEEAAEYAKQFSVFVVNEAGDTVPYSDYVAVLEVVDKELAAPKTATKKAK